MPTLPSLAALLPLLLPAPDVPGRTSEHLVLPDEEGAPVALLERKRSGIQGGVLREEELLWSGDRLHVLATEARRGGRLDLVWRELPGPRRRGRSWLLEQPAADASIRMDSLGSRRPSREVAAPETPLVGPLELEDLLRAGARPLEPLTLVDPVGGPLRTVLVRSFDPAEEPFAAAAARASVEALGWPAPSPGALQGFEWLDADGRAVRRLVLHGKELLAVQLEGRAAWARRCSPRRAGTVRARLRSADQVQSR